MRNKKTEYDLLLEYSEKLTRRNIQGFSNNIMNAYDFVAMAYEKEFNCYDDAIKIIRGLVINEKRRLIGLIQSKMVFDRAGEKKCRCCKKTKSFQEFQKRIDYSTNFQFFNSKCNDCQKAYQNSEKRKEQRRITYANSDQQKRSARIRYERFRDKKKRAKEKLMF